MNNPFIIPLPRNAKLRPMNRRPDSQASTDRSLTSAMAVGQSLYTNNKKVGDNRLWLYPKTGARISSVCIVPISLALIIPLKVTGSMAVRATVSTSMPRCLASGTRRMGGR